MWNQIGADDAQGLQRHVSLMRQMDRGYESLAPSDLVDVMRFQQGELWSYDAPAFHIGMLFSYSRERQHWVLAQVGFSGGVQPAEALEINVLRGRDFLSAHTASSVLAVRPWKMDFQPLLAYYDLCVTHPNLKITVLYENEEKQIWEIGYLS